VQFFLAGGFPMILITVFGAVAVVSAIRFVFAPSIGRLVHLCALCVALLSAGTAGVAADLRAVSVNVSADPEWATSDELPMVLLVGFGESMTPAILSLSIVACVALIAALGVRRLPIDA
jgi:hypothetical protein